MPRPPRADEANGLYHALNRGNSRAEIFRNEEDYAAFERILGEGLLNCTLGEVGQQTDLFKNLGSRRCCECLTKHTTPQGAKDGQA